MNGAKSSSRYCPPASWEPDQLAKRLVERGYLVSEGRASREKMRLFDTFDWRLFAKGLVLCHRRGEYLLHDGEGGDEIARARGKLSGSGLFFQDTPPGPLRGALGKIASMRRLLPLLDLSAINRLWEVRNRDDKLVLRYRWRELTPRRFRWRLDPHPPPPSGSHPPSSLHILVLEPVTGYSKPLREVRELLRQQKIPVAAQLSEQLYRRAGFTPHRAQKEPVSWSPHCPAGRVAMEILQQQYQVMRLNEAGVLADVDSEFLHDFRVALRRSRAVLARIKGVFPPGELKRFRPKLAELARMSNRLRDLDVYLLRKEEYHGMLPPALRPGLIPLFEALEEERREEFRKLARRMRGRDYRRSMEQWAGFLASEAEKYPDVAGGPGGMEESGESGNSRASQPVLPLAEKAIAKACSRLLAHGRAIGPDSPDEALHALRLDCKKLRYLFEFFSPLFPSEQMDSLVRRTKKLQDNLGAFNDLFVQRESLRRFLTNLGRQLQGREGGGEGSSARVATAAAIGGLIAILHLEQQKVRRNFAKTFKGFESCEHRKKICPKG